MLPLNPSPFLLIITIIIIICRSSSKDWIILLHVVTEHWSSCTKFWGFGFTQHFLSDPSRFPFSCSLSALMLSFFPQDTKFFCHLALVKQCVAGSPVVAAFAGSGWWPVNYCSCCTYFSVAAVKESAVSFHFHLFVLFKLPEEAPYITVLWLQGMVSYFSFHFGVSLNFDFCLLEMV